MKMYRKELKPGIALAEQRLFLSFFCRTFIWNSPRKVLSEGISETPEKTGW